MRLILSVQARKSIWIVADRRLASDGGRHRDDARKVLALETSDGVALLGYAGPGVSRGGLEPCDWMARVLRGRNLPLEQCLRVLADTISARMPRHFTGLRTASHQVLVPAFQRGEPRLYTIGLVQPDEPAAYGLELRRHTGPSIAKPPRIALAGAGARHLARDLGWARPLLKAVAAHDAGRVSSRAVAGELARLNAQVSSMERSVSPRCIVAWRFEHGGCEHRYFHNCSEDAYAGMVPTIALGLEVTSLFANQVPALGGPPDSEPNGDAPDTSAVQAALAPLPTTPGDVPD